jgi:hypothetical protein
MLRPAISQVNAMSFDHNHGRSSIGNYTPTSPSYDPFTSDWQDGEEDELAQVAYHDSDSHPTYTEHKTDAPNQASSNPRESSRTVKNARHMRSHTEPYITSHGGSGHLHPLRSAGMRAGPNDAGITRPHLSRIVNVGTLVDAPPVEPDSNCESTPATEEKDVLVHEVR